MRTVGSKIPKHRRGQRVGHCSYCGVRWYTGDLVRDASGNWACPDDRGGRDVVTLNNLNAQGAKERHVSEVGDQSGAPYFAVDVDSPTPQRTTADDI